jgi:DNA-directed RNA polymerase subunit RPC12/RpoP
LLAQIEAEVGRELICPDCHAATVVPPIEQRLKKPPRSPSEIGQYSLAAISGSGSVAGPQDYVPVVCSVCHTRLHATADHVGGRLVCPDCGKRNVVPPPAPHLATST